MATAFAPVTERDPDFHAKITVCRTRIKDLVDEIRWLKAGRRVRNAQSSNQSRLVSVRLQARAWYNVYGALRNRPHEVPAPLDGGTIGAIGRAEKQLDQELKIQAVMAKVK